MSLTASCRPLSLVSFFLLGLASLCLWFCRVGVSACAIAGVFLLLSCSFLWVVGPLCVCLVCLAVVGSPPCRLLLPFPLRLVPCGAPGLVCTLVPPSGYLVAFVTAWLPCFIAGSVVVLCRPYFMLSHGSKGLWPCVGFVFPLHHDACVVGVLSITTLRYSPMMIQVPHWTPLSFTIAILKQ